MLKIDRRVPHLLAWQSLPGQEFEANLHLGVAYVRLQRFGNAVTVLEAARRAAEGSGPERIRRIGIPLAEARRGVGDAVGAAEALRESGLSDAEIKARLSAPPRR